MSKAPRRRSDAKTSAVSALRLGIAAAAATLAFFVLYIVAVRTALGQRLDNAALEGRTSRATVLAATDHLLNTISVTSLVLVGAAIVAIAVARRRLHLALVAALVVAGANATSELAKHVVLGRPDLTNPNPLGPSFPSGHTTVAMSLAVALVLVVPPHRRAVAALIGLGYAAAVGVGVVTAGWHRPSDVMGAFLVVTAWASAGTAVLITWRGIERDDAPGHDVEAVVDPTFAWGGALLLGVAFAGFVIVYLALRQDRLVAVRLTGAYVAALVAIVGTAFLAMATILTTIHGVGLDPAKLVNRAGARRGTKPPTR